MNPAVGNPAAMASPELWVTLLKSAAMLSIVLALLIGALFLMRRLLFGDARASGRGVIRMVASTHVAPKERIVLIEVSGERLLLGVTPHAINCLAKIPPDGRLDLPEPQGTVRFFPDFLKTAFSGRLRRNAMDDTG